MKKNHFENFDLNEKRFNIIKKNRSLTYLSDPSKDPFCWLIIANERSSYRCSTKSWGKWGSYGRRVHIRIICVIQLRQRRHGSRAKHVSQMSNEYGHFLKRASHLIHILNHFSINEMKFIYSSLRAVQQSVYRNRAITGNDIESLRNILLSFPRSSSTIGIICV